MASLGSKRFGDASKAWIGTRLVDGMISDLRKERDAFIKALSSAASVDLAPFAYDIVHDVERFCRRPNQRQKPAAREEIRRWERFAKQMSSSAQQLRDQLQQLHKVREQLEAWAKRGEADLASAQSDADVERLRIVIDLDRIVMDAVLRDAPQSFCGLSAREHKEWLTRVLVNLCDWLQVQVEVWDLHYPMRGRPPNLAADGLLHGLCEIYETAGGTPTASWSDTKASPQSPFAQFLTLIYLALPDDLRREAASSPSAFVKRADRVLIDRRNDFGPSFSTRLEPIISEP
jgi:hypothetical protein